MGTTPVSPAKPVTPPVVVHDRDAVHDQLVEVLGLARRKITILAPQLDPHLFNTAKVEQALRGLIIRDRHARVRILVEDAGETLRDNTRLMAICRRLSDFVLVRQVAERHQGLRTMFVLADRSAYVLQQDVARPDWLIDRHGGESLIELANRFRDLWSQAEPLEGMQTAGLT